MKKILVLLTILAVSFQITSCKGKESQEEDVQQIDNAAVEKVEAEDAALLAESDGISTDSSLQAALGEVESSSSDSSVPSEIITSDTAPATEIAAAPTLDESAVESSLTESPVSQTETVAMSSDTGSESGITETPVAETQVASTEGEITETPISEVATNNESTFQATETKPEYQASHSSSTTVASASSALRKTSEVTPYQKSGKWINTVYFARPGQTWKEISKNIYGSDAQAKDLKRVNSMYASKSKMGGGEKIYYSSPNRPTDSAQMLSYYEDNGMTPETYVAKKGDSLRKVSSELLGYGNAWKEVWSTNAVDSKTALAEGSTIRYWRPASHASTANIAKNEAPKESGANIVESTSQLPSQPVAKVEQPPHPAEMPPAQPSAAMAKNDMPQLPPPPTPPSEEPAQQLAMNEPPPANDFNAAPPPAEPAPAQAQMDLPPPPPPPPPMPPAEPAHAKKSPMMDEEAAGQQDIMPILGVVAILCAALGYVLFKRNRKKKEAEQMMSETNVGT